VVLGSVEMWQRQGERENKRGRKGKEKEDGRREHRTQNIIHHLT